MSADYKRHDGRKFDETRPIHIQSGFMPNSEGSALVKLGNTHVICSATIDAEVPRWMRGRGTGWVTAEYGMLPRSTTERVDRRRSSTSGRTKEIERLIGRSLRAVTDMSALGEYAITIDCDVLRADGGTRTAAITGGYVALALAVDTIEKDRNPANPILKDSVAAISVGVVEGICMLDLPYEEDSRADVDMNVVMTGSGNFVEIQGTAESSPFTTSQLQELLALAKIGCDAMTRVQRLALSNDFDPDASQL